MSPSSHLGSIWASEPVEESVNAGVVNQSAASNSRDRPNSRVTSRHFDHSEQPRRYASFRPLSHRVAQPIDHPPNLSRL